MLERFLQCCTSSDANSGNEFKVVQLSSDVMECQMAQPVHLLTQQDSFDMTVTPRTNCKGERPRTSPITPRQRTFRDRIRLPKLRRYPLPPNCAHDAPEEQRRGELLELYQEFVLDLHKGVHMTQLTSNQDYSDIHCQILEDLQTLKVDQGSGCIIEFPLSAVSKVYRIVKNDDKWYSAGSLTGPTPMPPLPLSNAEHIVVVEFMRRKLAFVFNEMSGAQRFLMCIELLIRRAQESRSEIDFESFRSRPKNAENGSIAPMFSGHSARGPGERFERSASQPHKDNDPSGATCSCQTQPI
mmetsp:Transcript_93266/g.208399  ORF Transcript_93266/g.208399 Transcript_93266/m.208399 type:complete len:298 (-) Transcript_93266:37-930(-)